MLFEAGIVKLADRYTTESVPANHGTGNGAVHFLIGDAESEERSETEA